MALSNINFEKAKSVSLMHMYREANKEPSYLLPPEHRKPNEYWRSEKTAQQIFGEHNTIKKRGRQASLDNNKWEAEVNLNHNHTMEDIHRVIKHIEQKFGFTAYAAAIHRDEGRMEKLSNGNLYPVYNLHAHICFVTYKDNQARMRLTTKQDFRDLQTEVAQILGMGRGIDKRQSKKQHLNHWDYKRKLREYEARSAQFDKILKENYISKTEVEQLTQKQVNERIEQERKKYIAEGGHTKENYAKLRKLKLGNYGSYDELETELEKLRQELKAKENEHSNELGHLVQNNTELALKSKNYSEVIQTITQEIKTLKIENNELKKHMKEFIPLEEVKIIICKFDELESLRMDINRWINNLSLPTQAKNTRLQDIYKASDRLMSMLTQNPYLENFFSFDKYRETYQGAKETLEKERFLRGKTHSKGKSL